MNSNLTKHQGIRNYYQSILENNNFKHYKNLVNEELDTYFNKLFISKHCIKYSITPMMDLTIYPISIKINDTYEYLASAHKHDSKDCIRYDLYYGGYMSNDGEYKLYQEVICNTCPEVIKMAEYVKSKQIAFKFDAVPGTKNLESFTEDVFNYLLAYIIVDVFNTPAGYYSTLSYPTYSYLFEMYKEYIKTTEVTFMNSREGAKFITLNPVENHNVFNITYKPWRELYLNIITSNIKRNLLSPVFDISHGAAIFLSDRRNFINPNILSKYDLNKVAPKYIDKLAEMHNITRQDREDGIISRKMEKDLNKIFNKARDTITDNTLTNKVLVIFQNSFATSFDSFLMAKIHDIPNVDKHYNFDIFADFTTFNKYVFELFHGLFVMHNVLNFTHCDLHANNILIRPWITTQATYKPEHRVLYRICGKNYCFRPTSNTAQIIDFGRSILGKSHAPQISKKIGDFAKNLFYSDQQDQITALLEMLMPDEIDTVKSANFDFEQMFKLSCIMDYMAVLKAMNQAIDKVITNLEILDFMKRAIKLVDAAAIKLLNDCVTGNLSGPDHIKNVEDLLISSLFAHESEDDIEKYTFINVYDANFKVNIKFEDLDTYKFQEFNAFYSSININTDVLFQTRFRAVFRNSLYEKFRIEYVYPVI